MDLAAAVDNFEYTVNSLSPGKYFIFTFPLKLFNYNIESINRHDNGMFTIYYTSGLFGPIAISYCSDKEQAIKKFIKPGFKTKLGKIIYK